MLTAAHCNTLKHTATHCNTLQRAATHHNAALRCEYECCDAALQHSVARCSTLQHTATLEAESWHMYMWCVTRSCVERDSFTCATGGAPRPICVSHVNKSCESVMCHIWMSHVPHMNELSPSYEWLIQWIIFMQMWGGAPPMKLGGTSVSHMNQSCHLWCVVSHIWMSHVPHINTSCLFYEWPIQYYVCKCQGVHHRWNSTTWMNHFSHVNESCPTY